MNAITKQQIDFIRNKQQIDFIKNHLPEIVKRFNEDNKCNTKVSQWIKLTKVQVNKSNRSSYKIESDFVSIDDLLDPSVEKLEFAIGFILVDDNWIPVFGGDTMYHGEIEVKVYNEYIHRDYANLQGLKFWEVKCFRKHDGEDVNYFMPLKELSFVKKYQTKYYTIEMPESPQLVSFPRPINNQLEDFKDEAKEVFSISVFGKTYHFFTEKDRNTFNTEVSNFLESLKSDYKL